MTSKQSLTVAVVLIAITITMLIASVSGDPDAYTCQGNASQARGAVIPAGNHYGWGNHANYSPGLIWDEDADDCYTTLQSDDDADCPWAWSADDGDSEQADNSYGYNSGYDGTSAAPDENNGTF